MSEKKPGQIMSKADRDRIRQAAAKKKKAKADKGA